MVMVAVLMREVLLGPVLKRPKRDNKTVRGFSTAKISMLRSETYVCSSGLQARHILASKVSNSKTVNT